MTCKQVATLKGGLWDKQYDRARRVYSAEACSPTITCKRGGGVEPKIMLNLANNYKGRTRKLTPRECWRLMGFTDEDFDKVKDLNSNTQLYNQAGNSIVVPVIEGILKNLLPKEDDLISWVSDLLG